MRGVDLMDEEIQFYRFPHRSTKWWRRVFYHIFEIAVYNSYKIWDKNNSGDKMTYLFYKKTLSQELLNKGKKIMIESAKVGAIPEVIIYNHKEYFVLLVDLKGFVNTAKFQGH